AALTPVWCECRYATLCRNLTTASVYPTIFSPSNAPSTCPPVSDATTNIVTGSSSRSASPQISRCSSTHASYSFNAAHFRTTIPALIVSAPPRVQAGAPPSVFEGGSSPGSWPHPTAIPSPLAELSQNLARSLSPAAPSL